MKTEIMIVTPAMAEKWLENNHMKQRNLSPSLVAHYAQQMESGQWVLNGESLIFDDKGNLLDGQHRLNAIIKSGVTCEMLAVIGVSQDVFITINGGKTRSMSNVMAISGIPNYTNIAACVNGVMNYRRALRIKRAVRDKEGKILRIEHGGSLSTYIRPSKADMMDEYNRHADEYQKAIRITARCKHLGSHSVFAIVAAIALIDGNHSEYVEGFYESLGKGLFDNEDAPEYKLKSRLEKNRTDKSKLSNKFTILLIAKAWNFYANESECKVLKLGSENVFPIE